MRILGNRLLVIVLLSIGAVAPAGEKRRSVDKATQKAKEFEVKVVKKADLEGKLAGAFGSYTHSGDVPAIMFDTMQYVYKRKRFDLGFFNLKEAVVERSESMRSSQDYGSCFW